MNPLIKKRFDHFTLQQGASRPDAPLHHIRVTSPCQTRPFLSPIATKLIFDTFCYKIPVSPSPAPATPTKKPLKPAHLWLKWFTHRHTYLFTCPASGKRHNHSPTSTHIVATAPTTQGQFGNRHHTIRQETVIMLQASHLALLGIALCCSH